MWFLFGTIAIAAYTHERKDIDCTPKLSIAEMTVGAEEPHLCYRLDIAGVVRRRGN